MATAWTEKTLRWHLSLLEGLLPTTTITALTPGLRAKLLRHAFTIQAETWLANTRGAHKGDYAGGIARLIGQAPSPKVVKAWEDGVDRSNQP